jgi:hypothetical protein
MSWPLLCAALALSLVTTARADPAAEAAYLDQLGGRWNMVGTVRGKPVQYVADGERVLQGGFMKLHLVDAAIPPKYEADIYVGFDARRNDYVAHWLDRFGAAGARTVGTGSRNGDRLVIRFPYEDGAFRNTWSHEARADSWALLIESQEPDGTWSTFADYRLTRGR